MTPAERKKRKRKKESSPRIVYRNTKKKIVFFCVCYFSGIRLELPSFHHSRGERDEELDVPRATKAPNFNHHFMSSAFIASLGYLFIYSPRHPPTNSFFIIVFMIMMIIMKIIIIMKTTTEESEEEKKPIYPFQLEEEAPTISCAASISARSSVMNSCKLRGPS